MAHVKCSNMGHNACMCSNKVDNQATLPKKNAKISKRKCYGCHKKGHEIGSCPNKKTEGLMSSRKRLIGKEASKRQEEKTSYKNKHLLCYACQREGHKISECPNKDNISSRPTQVQVSKKIQHEKANKIKSRICYTCRRKGHLSKDCSKGNLSKPNSVVYTSMLRKTTNGDSTSKVMCSPQTSTSAIWVPKYLLTNMNGPNKCWVPKQA